MLNGPPGPTASTLVWGAPQAAHPVRASFNAVKIQRLAIIVMTVSLGVLPACSGEGEEPMANSGITTLQKHDVTPGTGAEATPGRSVRVHYTGWLYDSGAADHKGKKFDSSRDRDEPFEFRVGAREVIEGWDEGVAGMKVGGTRLLTIPPALGYGSQGAGGVIPPNATLLFEVELLDVR
jgi:FKBP-type peptidyl-prolyl cis-trans isomerase FkpA